MKKINPNVVLVIALSLSFLMGFGSSRLYAFWFSHSLLPTTGTVPIKPTTPGPAPQEVCYACGSASKQDCPVSASGSWWQDCQWNCEGRFCTCVETSGCGGS